MVPPVVAVALADGLLISAEAVVAALVAFALSVVAAFAPELSPVVADVDDPAVDPLVVPERLEPVAAELPAMLLEPPVPTAPVDPDPLALVLFRVPEDLRPFLVEAVASSAARASIANESLVALAAAMRAWSRAKTASGCQ